MIDRAELRRLAQARLADAQALRFAGGYDGAIYLAGYAVELALKARICDTLRWSWFLSRRGEFNNYQSLRTHNLNVLLDFSSIQSRVRSDYEAAWGAVESWNPDWRYLPVGSTSEAVCLEMLEAVAMLLEVI